jgi:hypothetical protein
LRCGAGEGRAERFVSEPLVPDPAAIEAAGMAAGVPGLPRRFTWNGRNHLFEARTAGPRIQAGVIPEDGI